MSDFLDSLKARLYDFKTSPFLATLALSWMFCNYKLVLIFFSGDFETTEKITKISEQLKDVDYISPLLVALGYVLVFPILNIIFYAVKLWFNVAYNFVQQKIEDKTPMPLVKAKELKEKHLGLFKEQEKTIEELEEYKNKYLEKSNNVDKHIAEQVQKQTKWHETEKKTYENQINSLQKSLKQYENLLKEKENIVKELSKQTEKNESNLQEIQKIADENIDKYNKLKKEYDKNLKSKEIPQVSEKYLDMFDKNELKFLENVYRSDFIGNKDIHEWLAKIKQVLNIPLIEAEKLFVQLRDKSNLFRMTSQSSAAISHDGKNLLYEMFKTTE